MHNYFKVFHCQVYNFSQKATSETIQCMYLYQQHYKQTRNSQKKRSNDYVDLWSSNLKMNSQFSCSHHKRVEDVVTISNPTDR